MSNKDKQSFCLKILLLDFISRIKRHWLLIILIFCFILMQSFVFCQFFYPSNELLPYTRIDGVNLGGIKKDKAVVILDKLYANSTVSIYFGKSEKPYISPRLNKLGLNVSNSTRIKKSVYPWYLKIIPTSIFWAQYYIYDKYPTYNRNNETLNIFIYEEFGESCEVEPRNAQLEFSGSDINIVPSLTGGKCEISSVLKILSSVKPRLDNLKVQIGSIGKSPEINDKHARQFGEEIKNKVGSGVEILVNDKTEVIPSEKILNWVDLDVELGNLTFKLNATKASQYLSQEIAPEVSISPGITTVSTLDFVEISRTNGSNGRGLNVVETLNSIKFAINNSTQAQAVTMVIPPKVIYFRSYSSTDLGLTALLQQYADSNPGISSVSVTELTGSRRRASYNSDNVLISASTYKLYVAYSTLLRIESGYWSWSDQILDDGRDLTTCFNDMIVYSDNDCAESLAARAGWENVNTEAHEIGCNSTSLTSDDGYARTSSADLSLFLAQLQTGQILNQQSNRDLLINAMKSQVYREGIPSGVSGEVADKVGFINGVLNDAAIVYKPNSTYILVIMTDGASWEIIADFASKIDVVLSS